jgi:hypothetical protein
MTISQLPLSYCTNVHPGLDVAAVEGGLDEFAVPVAENFGRPLAAGLWLAEPVIRELCSGDDGLERFAERLHAQRLTCHTLNAFPYGNFHSERVKENVYVPDWSTEVRLNYTQDCARVLAALLPEGTSGSISTVPLGFKGFTHPETFLDECCTKLIALAKHLRALEGETGRRIRLAIEPEPLCLLEVTDETIAFFQRLHEAAARQDALGDVREYIGVCYDVCHQAVEFEDVAASIGALDDAGVRINKVHITCAIELVDPATNEAGREALARFVEPRYLHQTLVRSRSGEIERITDLTRELALNPPPREREADSWRVHFHVPVDADDLGPLGTTRSDLKSALARVAQLDYAPHLEVETYTWNVLPGEHVPLVEGLTRELVATQRLLEALE